MDITSPFIWSTVGTICFIVVCVQAALLVSRLFRASRPLRSYLLVCLPLVISAVVFWIAWRFFSAYTSIMYDNTHMDMARYSHLRMIAKLAIFLNLLQPLIDLGAFIFLLLTERKTCPRPSRRPA